MDKENNECSKDCVLYSECNLSKKTVNIAKEKVANIAHVLTNLCKIRSQDETDFKKNK